MSAATMLGLSDGQLIRWGIQQVLDAAGLEGTDYDTFVILMLETRELDQRQREAMLCAGHTRLRNALAAEIARRRAARCIGKPK